MNPRADLPIIEPFRIKSVDPIRPTTRAEREAILESAGFNLFGVRAEDVLIDLLTDSGTSAMSSEQWAAMMRGDESYAGARSFERFRSAVRLVLGFEEVVPVHQGRAAEHLLFQAVGGPGKIIPSNTHFDTTRANVEASGAAAVDLPCAEAGDLRSSYPFKGNVDLAALEACLEEHSGKVPLVLMTVTNNACGGQPVSLRNLRGARSLCSRFGVPLFLDACRFAENAWLVKKREAGHGHRPARAIAREFFDLADGCTMSAKKDLFANIGGFIACRDAALAARLRQRMVVTEGFPTYGGMAGRDLEAIAQGLHECLEEDYLEYRHASIRYVVERLTMRGVPVVQPAGGHAVFIDAARFFPHIPRAKLPGQTLAVELYLEGGLRTCEIGTVMLGRDDRPARHELVRLAIPRRTYTQSHMDYVIEVVAAVWDRRESVRGLEIVEAPAVLRHFGARFRRAGEAVGAASASAAN
ncbi:MAG: tryptophanase [Planctomycetota bacterium]